MADKVSAFGKYSGYSEARFDGYARRSDYLTLSDGTELAYDVLLPTRRGALAEEPLPVLLMHTTYLRAMNLVDRGQIVFDELFDLPWYAKGFLRLRAWSKKDGHIGDVVFRNAWLKRLLKHGYAVVVVERSGTGASTGLLSPAFADVAIEIDEVLNWVAAQPWCDGNVGMFGTSMVAMAQYAAASAGNPHLKAILPVASSFDMYSSITYPGGVNCTGFGRTLSGSTGVLERMIVPVDSDRDGARLAAVLGQRRERSLSDVSAAGFSQAPFRDSDNPYLKGRKLWLDVGLYTLLDAINRSGVAVYNSAGWYDLFARDSLLWHANLSASRRLHVRPLFHNDLGKAGPDLDFGAEAHRWFDHWLKGIDNGIMDEPPVHYYVMGAPKKMAWQHAPKSGRCREAARDALPPVGRAGAAASTSVNDGFLRISSLRMRRPDGADGYTVDYTTTSGTHARWSAVVKEGKYPQLHANDEKALTYTTAPLARGSGSRRPSPGPPMARRRGARPGPLRLPGGGGCPGACDIRHRGQPTGPRTGPPRRRPMTTWGCPIIEATKRYRAAPRRRAGRAGIRPAYRRPSASRRGSRIRLTVTCADADNFDTPALNPSPAIRVLRDAVHASFVELPLLPLPQLASITTGAVMFQRRRAS